MADQCIIFPNDEGGIGIVVPAPCGLTIEQIARKDVPAGKPFLIIDRSELPASREYRSAWTADFTSPDGHGIGHEAWVQEQADGN